MAYLCVNRNGDELICNSEPTRNKKYPYWDAFESIECEMIDFSIELPNGSIKKLIGKSLTWDDNPIEI